MYQIHLDKKHIHNNTFSTGVDTYINPMKGTRNKAPTDLRTTKTSFVSNYIFSSI